MAQLCLIRSWNAIIANASNLSDTYTQKDEQLSSASAFYTATDLIFIRLKVRIYRR